MPYEWSETEPDHITLVAWPYRSLPKRGFVAFIGITSAMFLFPLLAVLGSAILWGLLPFFLAAIGGVWWALNRSYQDGTLTEELTITPQTVRLVRKNPRRPQQSWEANPHWVKINKYPGTVPIEEYLTLTGSGREVELGAYLTPEERRSLFGELYQALARVKRPQL